MKKFQELVKEICDEKGVDIQVISKEWIIRLEKGESVNYILGMKFPLNDAVSATICKDKYATYEVLKNSKIPVIEHKLLYGKNLSDKYKSDLNNKSDLKKYLKEHYALVIKDTCGSCGIDVYYAKNYREVKKYLNKILERKDTAVISPFVDIKAEYRVICLDGNAEVVFEKVRDKNNWKHNLCNGASAILVKNEERRKELTNLALMVMKTIGLTFASVDLIDVNGELMVLEVNSIVCMSKFMEQVNGGREIAKSVYRKAIEKVMSL